MRLIDVFYAFPSVLLAIAISGILGAGLEQHDPVADDRLHAADGAHHGERHDAGPQPRLCRGGARQRRRHVARSSATTSSATCSAPILVYATSLISIGIILAAGLSFLGLGVTPPNAEWGLMLNTLRQAIYGRPDRRRVARGHDLHHLDVLQPAQRRAAQAMDVRPSWPDAAISSSARSRRRGRSRC